MYTTRLEKFEGPMDLLLGLIESEKMDITQVSLAKVTDQYLQYLEKMTDSNPEDLADFLVVAAKLLYIKSKSLLPYLQGGEEEACDLEAQLKIYKEYLDASKLINTRLLKKNFSFAREKFPSNLGKNLFNPPASLTAAKLKKMYLAILEDIRPMVNIAQEKIRKTISIQEKIQLVKDLLSSNASLDFRKLLYGAKSKVDVIVSFLAVLELIKQQVVIIKQESIFGEITIHRFS